MHNKKFNMFMQKAAGFFIIAQMALVTAFIFCSLFRII